MLHLFGQTLSRQSQLWVQWILSEEIYFWKCSNKWNSRTRAIGNQWESSNESAAASSMIIRLIDPCPRHTHIISSAHFSALHFCAISLNKAEEFCHIHKECSAGFLHPLLAALRKREQGFISNPLTRASFRDTWRWQARRGGAKAESCHLCQSQPSPNVNSLWLFLWALASTTIQFLGLFLLSH